MLASLQNTKTFQVTIQRYIANLQARYNDRLYSKKSIFLDSITTHTNIHDDVDIVLSPKFYWVRKASLPVKSVSKALKISADFFKDVLPDGDYKYKVIKSNDNFLLFAYQEDKILEAIKNSGIDLSFVNKVFFAQTELCDIDVVDIKNDEILYNKDDVLIELPRNIVSDDTKAIDIDHVMRSINKSKHYIAIDTNNNIIDSSISQRIIFALSFVVLAYFVEYLLVKDDVSRLSLVKQSVTKDYDIPSSTIAFNSIIKTLESKRKDSIQSRQDLHSVLGVSLKKGDSLKEVSFESVGDKKTFFIKVFLSDVKNATFYKDSLVKDFEINSVKVNANIASIRGQIE